MEMLKLLNTEDFTRFYLRSDLVEKIVPARANSSDILLTTGRWVHCGESPDQVAQMVMAAEQPLALDSGESRAENQ